MSFDYQIWLKSISSNKEYPKEVIERFLFNSLAIGTSKRTEGFIRELKISHSSSAQLFLERLNHEAFQTIFFDEVGDVEAYVESLNCLPWESEEFYACTRSKKAALYHAINELPEYKAVMGSKLKNEGKTFIRRRFQEIDAVFRHIRNALAHGCFCFHEKETQGRLFFFDVNDANRVSAVGYLSLQSLDACYALCCQMAERRL